MPGNEDQYHQSSFETQFSSLNETEETSEDETEDICLGFFDDPFPILCEVPYCPSSSTIICTSPECPSTVYLEPCLFKSSCCLEENENIPSEISNNNNSTAAISGRLKEDETKNSNGNLSCPKPVCICMSCKLRSRLTSPARTAKDSESKVAFCENHKICYSQTSDESCKFEPESKSKICCHTPCPRFFYSKPAGYTSEILLQDCKSKLRQRSGDDRNSGILKPIWQKVKQCESSSQTSAKDSDFRFISPVGKFIQIKNIPKSTTLHFRPLMLLKGGKLIKCICDKNFGLQDYCEYHDTFEDEVINTYECIPLKNIYFLRPSTSEGTSQEKNLCSTGCGSSTCLTNYTTSSVST